MAREVVWRSEMQIGLLVVRVVTLSIWMYTVRSVLSLMNAWITKCHEQLQIVYVELCFFGHSGPPILTL